MFTGTAISVVWDLIIRVYRIGRGASEGRVLYWRCVYLEAGDDAIIEVNICSCYSRIPRTVILQEKSGDLHLSETSSDSFDKRVTTTKCSSSWYDEAKLNVEIAY